MDAVTMLMIQQRWPKQVLVLNTGLGGNILVYVHAGCVHERGYEKQLELPHHGNAPMQYNSRCGICSEQVELHYSAYHMSVSCPNGIPPEELKALL